jgi:uncharacterized protein
MKDTSNSVWNPERLDMRAFARAAASLEAAEPLTRFERLLGEVVLEAIASPTPVSWLAQGEMRPGATEGAPSAWLHLQARTAVPLICQRCLGPVETPLVVDRWFRFVADEATAAAEDDDCEEDLLALDPRPSLHDLLEDELLMELPLVPMHEGCPVSVPMQAGELAEDPHEAETARKSPFAELARLKK